MKESCVSQTNGFEQKKIALSKGGNKTEIDFVLVGKNKKYLRYDCIFREITTSVGDKKT